MKTNPGKRNFLLLFTLLLFLHNTQAQTSFLWGRQFGSEKEEYALNHVVDKEGNIYVSGRTAGNMACSNLGNNDGFITKIDSNGIILWSKQFGTNGDEDIQWSAIDSKGNIYITGSTTGVMDNKNHGETDILVVKYSGAGQLQWTRQFGTDSTDTGKGIFADNKGDIYLTGITTGKLGSSSFGKADGFIMKLDSGGNLIFTYQFGTASDDFSNSITGDNRGWIYVCGLTWGDLGGKNSGMIDAFTGQFTSEGIPVKFNQFGSEGFDIAMAIKADNDKSVYVGGSTSGNLGCRQIGEGDCFLTKINGNGEIIWTSQFGTMKHDGIRSIAMNNEVSDNILVSGLLNLPPAEAFIRMYRKDGILLWEKNLVTDHPGCDASGKDISVDRSGNICLMGLTHSNLFGASSGESDIFLLKLKLDP